MNQDNTVGFFRQYMIACFQPSKYRKLLEKKRKSQIGYVCLLIIFLVFIESVIPFAAWNVSVGGIKNMFENRFPEFSIQKGTMEVSSPVAFEIGTVIRVRMDSDVKQFKKTDFDMQYQEEVLISKENMLVRAGERMTEVSFASMKQVVFNKQNMIAAMPMIYFFIFVYFLIMILSKAIQYLLMAAVFAFICRAGVRTSDGKSVSMKEAFLISIYAKTLFSLLSSINACLGYLVSSFILMCISAFLTMHYIYRAEVSVLQPELS